MRKLSLLIVLLSGMAHAETYSLQIPSDPKASYTVLEKSKTSSNATIVTKREGTSGVTFTKRSYNCSVGEYKLIGQGETLEQMNAFKPDESFSPIVEGSITYYVGQEACS